MSIRIDLRDDLLAAVQTANSGVSIDDWAGEEAVFNTAHAWPSIAVAYAGTEFGESEEIGVTTYARSHIFHIFVCAANVAGGAAGDATAMTILENTETAVSGQLISDLGLAEVISEELVHVHMGRYLYAQTWKIVLLESH